MRLDCYPFPTSLGALALHFAFANAILPRLLAVQPRPNVANIPAKPKASPNLRDLGSDLIKGGIEQIGSAVFTPDTSVFAGTGMFPHSTARPTTTNAFGIWGTTTSNNFNVWSTSIGNGFDNQPTSTSNPFDVGAPSGDDFDIDISATVSDLFPRETPMPSNAAFIPSCPRAALYIDYCASWYGNDWYTPEVQAYCLCYGPASTSTTEDPSAPETLIWIPDLFDSDAQACRDAYTEAVAYWKDIYNGNSEFAGDYRVEAAWNESVYFEDAWGEAASFCNDAGNGLHAAMVDVAYFESEAVLTDDAATTATQPEPAVTAYRNGAGGRRHNHLVYAAVAAFVEAIMLL